MRTGYMSGGAGYVISSSALRNVVNIGFKNGACKQDGGNEDEEIGICLAVRIRECVNKYRVYYSVFL